MHEAFRQRQALWRAGEHPSDARNDDSVVSRDVLSYREDSDRHQCNLRHW